MLQYSHKGGAFMIDLHLHMDGSLIAENIIYLANKQDIALPSQNIETVNAMLSAPINCSSLNEYLKCFDLPLLVLQSFEALEYAFYHLVHRLAKEGLIYAEIRFAPQLHTNSRLTQKRAVEAAISGINTAMKENSSIFAQLILCAMRGKVNDTANMETIAVAETFMENGVAAVDLAGAEALYKTADYSALFRQVSERRIPFTIHAGEADGAESVWKAVSFGAKRIGHGVRSVEDEKLVSVLAEQGITLELCLSSNLQTKAVASIQEFPLRKFLEKGVKVTINTDNTTVSQTNIENEFQLLRDKINLTKIEEKNLLLNSANAAFVSETKREEIISKIIKKYS